MTNEKVKSFPISNLAGGIPFRQGLTRAHTHTHTSAGAHARTHAHMSVYPRAESARAQIYWTYSSVSSTSRTKMSQLFESIYEDESSQSVA